MFDRKVLAILPAFLSLQLITFSFAQQSSPSDSAVALQIIVVSSPLEALDILSRLKKGEDFATLAKQRSIDPSAENGGHLGLLSLDSLRPELRQALVNMKPGDVAGPVLTPIGYSILKLSGSAPAADPRENRGTAGTASVGSVKYTLGVGGLGEGTLPLSKAAQERGWDPTPEAVCRLKQDPSYKRALEDFLSPTNSRFNAAISESPLDVLHLYFSLGELNSYHGDMQAAIEQYEKAEQLAISRVPDAKLHMEEALGIAYLHKSEMENDVYRKPGEKCLLPMLATSKYPQTEDSRKAIKHFLKYLAEKPDELEVKWLLNLAYMTVGEYPSGVPKQYLISPSAFESGEQMARFRDVAPEAGLDTVSLAGGVIVDDFENNGRLDIVKSSYDSCAPLQYFHNNGDGTFTEQASKAGLGDQLGGLNIIQTDYNNDGCLDILVMRGGWEIPQYKSLLRNNCNGTFTDVTKSVGLTVPTSTQAAVWVDINNDGFLDLFIGNENGPAQLFLNKGDGTFEDISHSAGIDQVGFVKGVAAGDYDNDGYPDLFVTNFSGTNILYHNNHDNTFTDVSEAAGVQDSTRGFATWFFDYDNDGWPDLFVTSYFFSDEETACTYLGLPHNATTLKLYKNLGNGTFRDVTAEVGLDKVFMPMGANFGDIDNDGFLDVYMGTGNPSYGSLVPNVLLHNNGGISFTDVTTATGTGDWHKGHGVAFADLSNRGFEDIVAEMGGATPGDAHAMRVFENPGNENDWITLKLVGVKTNRPAIGARIKITVQNDGGKTRSIYRTVGSGGSFGASPLQQHIGLGKKTKILDVEIWWPASNTRQHFANVEKDQFLDISEFSQEYARLDRKPYKLGTSNRNALLNPVRAPTTSQSSN